MAKYVYTIVQWVNDTPDWRLTSTYKWQAVDWLRENVLEKGVSLGNYDVVRSKDGQPGTAEFADIYEFMNIDLGETL